MPGKDSLQSIADIKKIKKEFDFIADGLFLIKDTIMQLNKYELFGKSSKSVKEVAIATRDLAKELNEAQKVNAKLIEQQAKQERSRKSTIKLTIEEKEALRQRNAEAKREAQVNLAASGTVEKAIALRNKLRAEVLKTDINDVARIKTLNDRIDKLTAIEKKFSDKQKNQGLNVGNYEGSAKIIVEALKDVENEITKLQAKQKGLQDLSKNNPIGFKLGNAEDELKDVNAQLEIATQKSIALQGITSNPKFLNIASGVGDTRKEIGFMVGQLNKLEDAGLKNSDVYLDVQKRLAELTDQMQDTRQEIKALASDTRSFDLFAGSVSFAADTFQTLAGASILFGASEEKVAEQTRTLVAIQTVANGIKGVANELTTKGTAANKAYNFVLAQTQTLSSSAATGTQKFGAALKLGLIGAAIFGLTKLVSWLSSTSSAAKKASTDIDNFNESLKNTQFFNNRYLSSIRNQNQLAIEKAKQRGASEAEVSRITADGYKKEAEEFSKLYNQKQGQLSILAQQVDDATKGQLKLVSDYNKQFRDGMVTSAELIDRLSTIKSSDVYLNLSKDQKEAVDKLASSALEVNGLLESSYAANASSVQETEQFKTKTIEEQNKKRIEALKKHIQDELDLENKRAQALYDIRVEGLNFRLRKAEEQAANQELDGDIRVNAEKTAAALRRTIALEEYLASIKDEKVFQDDKVKIIKKTDEELKLAKVKYINTIEEINRQSAQTEIGISKEAAEKILQDREAILLEQERQAGEAHDKAVDDAQAANARELLELDKKFAKGKLREDKYAKERLRLQAKLSLQLLDEEVKYTKKIIELAEARARLTGTQEDIDAVLSAKRKLAALEIQIEQATFDTTKDLSKKKLDELSKLFGKVQQIAQGVFDVVGGIINAISEKEKNAIQEQIDLLDEKKAKDIEAANQSIVNAKDREAAISIINQRADAQKQLLENRQRMADERKARFEKAVTIAKIIIDTASAVIAQLKIPGNLAGAIAVGALGAIQLGIAAATQIPKYKQGTKNHPGGLMIVGDGGKSEGVTMPDGTVLKTPAIPTLMDAPYGTKVDSDFSRMALGSTPDVIVMTPLSVEKAINKMGTGVIAAIKNKRETRIVGMPRHRTYLKDGHSFKRYINDRM